MNIIFSGFVHPIIGVVSGYLLIFGSEFTGKILLRKSPYSFFFLNLSTGVIAVSLIAYIFILLGIFGVASMWEAVFGDVGVTILAVLNSTRVLKAWSNIY